MVGGGSFVHGGIVAAQKLRENTHQYSSWTTTNGARGKRTAENLVCYKSHTLAAGASLCLRAFENQKKGPMCINVPTLCVCVCVDVYAKRKTSFDSFELLSRSNTAQEYIHIYTHVGDTL